MPKEDKAGVAVYQIKITLTGSKPPIWRRFQVRGDTSLARLHDIIQIIMGWESYHLHEFIVRNAFRVSNPEFELDGTQDESRVALQDIAPEEKCRVEYVYDFGDGWRHDILVEKIIPPEEGKRYPVCLKGKRACPPEDCGGIWGYEAFLEAIADPEHPDHQELLDWIGGSFDPEELDLDEINAMLGSK